MSDIIKEKERARRRGVNLTIRADLLEQAKELKLNASQAAETGIAAAVKKAREQAWLTENAEAIAAHNKRIEEEGLLITPLWLRD